MTGSNPCELYRVIRSPKGPWNTLARYGKALSSLAVASHGEEGPRIQGIKGLFCMTGILLLFQHISVTARVDRL